MSFYRHYNPPLKNKGGFFFYILLSNKRKNQRELVYLERTAG